MLIINKAIQLKYCIIGVAWLVRVKTLFSS